MGQVIVNGVELAVEHFGDRADPAIVLIGGLGSTMDLWTPAFCQRLADGGRLVIRYDQRDTGESMTDPPGQPSYRLTDLVGDIFGLLDSVGAVRGHLVGLSMGGAVAQLAAIDQPERVASLTLIATSSGSGDDLPTITPELRQFYADHPGPDDWSDRSSLVEYLVAYERALGGQYFDADESRTRTTAVVARSRDMRSSLTNAMALPREEPWRDKLSTLDMPTLVIHGTADPMFQLAHGEALARDIPGARLLAVPGMGHELPPPPTWDVVVPAILSITSGGWPRQADRLAKRALAAGEPTAWFERLYASGAAGETGLPWDTAEPRAPLIEWAGVRSGRGQRAIVVGAGLGQNSEFVAGLGYDTVAFDISPTAIRLVRERFPSSTVEYRVADLLDPPAEWRGAFDLVVEIITVQALPVELRAAATAAVASFTAPGGTLLVISGARGDDEPVRENPPWPLTRAEIDAFATADLQPVRVEYLDSGPWWRAEFRRRGSHEDAQEP